MPSCRADFFQQEGMGVVIVRPGGYLGEDTFAYGHACDRGQE